MTQVNLGRIAIIPQGTWTAGTYKALDLVRYNGASYIAKSTTTATPTNTTYWDLVNQDGATGATGATGAQGATGGGIILLSTVTASSSATVDVENTFDSTYDEYVIIVTGMTCGTNATRPHIRMKFGSAYATSNYTFHSSSRLSSANTYAATVAPSDAQISMSLSDMSNVATLPGSSASFEVRITNPSSTITKKTISWKGTFMSTASTIVVLEGAALNTATTNALTGIRFQMSSGVIASGIFRLYGIIKT